MLSRVTFSAIPRPESLPPESGPSRLEQPPIDFLAEEARVVGDVLRQRPGNDYTTRLDFSTNPELARARGALTTRMIRIARLMTPDDATAHADNLRLALGAYEQAKAEGLEKSGPARAFLESTLGRVNSILRDTRLAAARVRKQGILDWQAAKGFARAEYIAAYRREQARQFLPVRMGSKLLDYLFPGRIERILPFELQRRYRPYQRFEKLIDPYAASVPNPRATYFDEGYGKFRKRFKIVRERVPVSLEPTFECEVQDYKLGNRRNRRYRVPKGVPVVGSDRWPISSTPMVPGEAMRRALKNAIEMPPKTFSVS